MTNEILNVYNAVHILLKMIFIVPLITLLVWLNIISESVTVSIGVRQEADAIVAQDGSGDFTAIMGAISAASNHSLKPYYIKIKKGIYLEYIRIKKWKPNIVLLGEGMDNTIISGNRSFGGGIKTYNIATIGKFILFNYFEFKIHTYIINFFTIKVSMGTP